MFSKIQKFVHLNMSVIQGRDLEQGCPQNFFLGKEATKKHSILLLKGNYILVDILLIKNISTKITEGPVQQLTLRTDFYGCQI